MHTEHGEALHIPQPEDTWPVRTPSRAPPLSPLAGLPLVSGADLESIVARLSPDDAVLALRQRILPLDGRSSASGFLVADRMSLDAAVLRAGPVVARSNATELLKLLEHRFARQLVNRACSELTDVMPEMSAHRRLHPGQAVALLLAVLAFAAGWWIDALSARIVLTVTCGLLFLGVVAIRAGSLFERPGRRAPRPRRLHDDQLPVYSVLVPLFRETAVVDQLVAALSAFDYPASKLDIKLILEQEDIELRRHVRQLHLPAHFEVLTVPHAHPQTKPKALNYALQFARGELLAIYDAEDIPDRRQLREAAGTFAAGPRSMACLQARLAFYNSNENWLTRQFAIEYAALFDLLLPMLARFGMPLPLGGTSNHFRIDVLRRAGGWDAYNVTEDADLGLRLARFGWRCGVISTITHEEANCQLPNWLSQRARWLKGWLQTWFVHLRSPRRLWRELGPSSFIIAQVMMIGMIVTALLHPVFVAALIYSLLSGTVFPGQPNPVASYLAGLGIVVLVTGYAVTMAAGAKGLLIRRQGRLIGAVATMPVYWLLISLGGWLALWQFLRQPFHWNKTNHGLSRLGQTRRFRASR